MPEDSDKVGMRERVGGRHQGEGLKTLKMLSILLVVIMSNKISLQCPQCDKPDMALNSFIVQELAPCL